MNVHFRLNAQGVRGLNDKSNDAVILRLHRKFVCDNCGKTYKWRESLQQHRRLECGIEPQFGCIFCGRRFKHKHHLKEHLKRRHQSKLS
ncbi:longitudinals lacking protein, isoforms N/O/W/X/Y-like isoform X2 [Ptiloglossa arizonensis]|uniref:longitudinals lacking protein, isoforms N/O/W/X/Y-like isoform X2 n=1 Tax=Ptiloglossa arizonensis TaxID=3350558 RepID=UPI003F9F5967